MRARRRSHRGVRMVVLILGWTMMGVGLFFLLFVWPPTHNPKMLAIGGGYVLGAVAVLGIRQAAAIYSSMRHAKHSDESASVPPEPTEPPTTPPAGSPP